MVVIVIIGIYSYKYNFWMVHSRLWLYWVASWRIGCNCSYIIAIAISISISTSYKWW